MPYNKTTWVDNEAPYLNANNLNNIEDGIVANETDIQGLTMGEMYQGTWTPTAGTEYPSSPEESWSWYITGLDSNGYTFTTGDLVGRVANNSDKIIYNGTEWSMIDNVSNQLGYYLVDDVASMLALNPLHGALCTTYGYTTANDGGGGVFNYDSSLVGTNNGGTILNGWVRQYVDVVHAAWFPFLFDGSDETTQMQNVLDIAEGNTLVLQQDVVYNIDSISIKEGTKVVSNGSSFRRVATSNSYGIYLYHEAEVDHLQYSTPGTLGGEKGVNILESSVILGRLDVLCDTEDYGSIGLLISGTGQVSNTKIDKLIVDNFTTGVYANNVKYTYLTGAYISSYWTAIFLRDATYTYIRDSATDTPSTLADGEPGQNAILVEATLSSGSTRWLYVNNFRCDGTAEHGIRFGGQLSISDVFLDNIYIKRTGIGGTHGGCGLKILGATTVAGQPHKRFKISNLTISDGYTDATVGNFAGIFLSVVEDIQLDNCSITAVNNTYSAQLGLSIASATNVKVSNCSFQNAKNTAILFDANPAPTTGETNLIKNVSISDCDVQSDGAYTVWLGQNLVGTYEDITLNNIYAFGGGPGAVLRGETLNSGYFANIHTNFIHSSPNDTTAAPSIHDENQFMNNWTGPYYGTYNPTGLDGSKFTDEWTGAFRIRKAGAWVVL